MQLKHHNTNLNTHKYSIILVCDSVNSPANIGGLFRLADSFGVEKIVFGGVDVDLKSPRLKRTARSTQNWIPSEDKVNLDAYINELITREYMPVALEITKNSIPINKFKFPKEAKIALIIGDENTGISDTILKQCEKQLHITMFGKNSSMNVSQATAIALYELTKQLQDLTYG